MDGLIAISQVHYDFLLQKAQLQIRKEFDNDGNWIARQSLIEECISNEMPESFTNDLQADQDFELKVERMLSAQARKEFQESQLPANY